MDIIGGGCVIRRINAFVSEDHGEPVAPHGGTVLHFTPCRRLPAAKPEEVSLSSRRLQRTSKFMRRNVDENKLKGLLTVGCRKGKVAYCECCGLMDEQDSMQPDALLRIYS